MAVTASASEPRVLATEPRVLATEPGVLATEPRVLATELRVLATEPRVLATELRVLALRLRDLQARRQAVPVAAPAHEGMLRSKTKRMGLLVKDLRKSFPNTELLQPYLIH